MRSSDGYAQRLPTLRDDIAADDPRWAALTRGLDQLDDSHLARLWRAVSEREPLLLDNGNYDPESGLWCPLAVALDVPRFIAERGRVPLTAEEGRDVLTEVGSSKIPGFSTNPISGIPGTFYTSDRRADLEYLVWVASAERAQRRPTLTLDVMDASRRDGHAARLAG